MRRRTLPFICSALALLATFPKHIHALPGQVLDEQKISSTSGGFGGPLDNQDQFGASITSVGKLDGDMVRDLAVGAARDGDGGAGAVWVLFMDATGMVASEAKISATSGGFVGPLAASDQFGMAVAALGDLDGDTVPDLAVGADGDDDGGTNRGAIYILFLNANGTVKAEHKISSTAGGFTGSIANGDRFGSALASLGDLDGDGVVDIAAGAPLADGLGNARGAIWALFLQSNGTVKSSVRIDETTSSLSGTLSDFDLFGSSIAAFDDLNGDSVTDLAVGAAGDSQSGTARGAVWILSLEESGAVIDAAKINDTIGNFSATLDDNDAFGASAAVLPDLDGDGVDDLAVGATGDDTGGFDRGQIYVLFMMTDATVKNWRRINVPGSGFTGPLLNNEMFGNAAASLRDLDGDSIPDLAGGLRFSSDGGANRGAIYVILLDGVPGGLCGDGILDPSEECDDSNDEPNDCCAANCTLDPSGASCEDADVCNGDETCNGSGACLAGAPPDCNDGQACSRDSCDSVLGCSSSTGPAPVCRASSSASLTVADKPNAAGDKVDWRWSKGDTPLVAFGDPLDTDTYALCVYDTVAGVPALAVELVVPPSATKWSAKGDKGYGYKDAAAVESGVRTVMLQAGSGGKSKIIFKAKGAATALPGPAGATYFNQNPSVIVQLVNSQGECWGSELATPPSKNDAQGFKAKLP